MIILFSLRFIDEFFKMNQESFEDGLILNMGQWLSIPFVLAGVLLLIRIKGKGPSTFDTPPQRGEANPEII
jgi:prolipoprotein diacylglyceryltransferase